MKEIRIHSKDLVFDLKVVEACQTCKRYGTKGSCPPHINTIDFYQKLLPSYNNCIFYYDIFRVYKDNWEAEGKRTSLELHKFLLKKRDDLFNTGHHFVTIYGGGSCKFCNECSIICQYPNKRLIPLEGTGMNVVETLKKVNITLRFPITDFMLRVGAVFYD